MGCAASVEKAADDLEKEIDGEPQKAETAKADAQAGAPAETAKADPKAAAAPPAAAAEPAAAAAAAPAPAAAAAAAPAPQGASPEIEKMLKEIFTKFDTKNDSYWGDVQWNLFANHMKDNAKCDIAMYEVYADYKKAYPKMGCMEKDLKALYGDKDDVVRTMHATLDKPIKPYPKMAKKLEEIFKFFDKDADGILNYTEYNAFSKHMSDKGVSLKVMTEDEFKKAFPDPRNLDKFNESFFDSDELVDDMLKYIQ